MIIRINQNEYAISLDNAVELFEYLKKTIVCPYCASYSELRLIPDRYMDFMQTTLYVEITNRSSGAWVNKDSGKKDFACDTCISNAANHRKNKEHTEWLFNNGHIEPNKKVPSIRFLSPSNNSRRNTNKGFIYIAVHDINNMYFKIGATKSSIINRLLSQGYNRINFTHAIYCVSPFDLEYYLHEKYRSKKIAIPGRNEIFQLDNRDLQFIYEIKTFRNYTVQHFEEIDKLETCDEKIEYRIL